MARVNKTMRGPLPVPEVPRPVPRPDHGNEWYPLPPDYPELTKEGQRLARVNACMLRDTPEDFVAAWSFFRKTYLEPTPPGFFYRRKVNSPPGHYQWIRDIAQYSRNIHVAPRGSGKSTVFSREVPLWLTLTRPYTNILIVCSIHRHVRDNFSTLMQQFTDNEFIVRDFGNLQPVRNDGSGRQWSLSILQLTNGSVIQGCSVDGRKRGGRPDIVILDDPEYDPHDPTKETELSAQLERLLFREIFGMFDTQYSLFEWIGTFISCKSALYRAYLGEDPRFKRFNRRIYAARASDADGKPVYFWQEKWDERALEEKRAEVGHAAFEAEYQNNPVSDEARLFVLHPELAWYHEEGENVWTLKEGSDGLQRVTLARDEWLSSMRRIMTVDMRHGSSYNTDYSGALVTGIDVDKYWWILDLYLARCSPKQLLQKIWELGCKWQVSLIGIESAAGQIAMVSWVQENLESLLEKHGGWRPRVYAIRYPSRVAKEDRINALDAKFTAHAVKLPADRRNRWPFTELIRQIEMYTPDGRSLAHDDALDMLSMVLYCPRRAPNPDAYEGAQSRDFYEQLAAGEILDATTGLPLAHAVDISRVPLHVLQEFLDKRREIEEYAAERGSRVSALRRRGALGAPSRLQSPAVRAGLWPPRPAHLILSDETP